MQLAALHRLAHTLTTKGLIQPFVASHFTYTQPSELLEKRDKYLHF